MSRAFTRSLAARWLRGRLPPAAWSATMGDLDEEFQDMRTQRGRWRAETWFVTQVWSVGRAYAQDSSRAGGSALGRFGRDILHGLRDSARFLRREPSYTVVAAGSLAVGLAAILLTAGLADAILRRQLSDVEPDRVRRVAHRLSGGSPGMAMSFVELETARQHVGPLAGISAAAFTPALLRINNVTTQDMIDVTSGPHFDVLKLPALAGRLLASDDDRPGQARVMVISDQFWRSHFNAAPDAVGQALHINNLPYTIIGVAPTVPSLGFFGAPAAGWVPAATADSLLPAGWRTDAGARAFVSAARLAPGTSSAQFDDRLSAASNALKVTHPERWRDRMLASEDGRLVVGALRRTAGFVTALLTGMAGLMLIAAAANVGGLTFAQSLARRRTTAIRTALGASRQSIGIQVLCEGAMLGLTGGGVALLLYLWFARAAATISLLPTLSLQVPLPFDWQVVALTLGLSITAGVVMSLTPALASMRLPVTMSLVEVAGRQIGGRGGQRARRWLLSAQLAASLVLVVMAALFTRSLQAMETSSLGVDVDRIAAFDLDQEPLSVPANALEALAADAVARLKTLPGIVNAAMADRAPIDSSTLTGSITAGTLTLPDVTRLDVTPDYFDTVGVKIIQGRGFTTADNDRDVAIVNETLARQLGGTQSIRLMPSGRLLEVVGVASNSRYRSIAETPQPHFYLPVSPRFHMALLVRTSGDPRLVLDDVQRALDGVGPGVQGFFPRTGRDHLKVDLLTTSVASVMARALGLVAAGLAATGLYGLLTWAVQMRRQEIGLRLALGATGRDIRRLVFTQALKGSWQGLLAGGVAASLAAWALRSQWFGVQLFDPVVLLAVGASQLALVLLASWLPARRAAKISPLELLR